MTFGVAAFVALVGLGYFPARLVTRSPIGAALASPLATALITTVWAMACVPLGLPLLAAVVGTALTSGVAAVALLGSARWRATATHESALALLVPFGGAVAFATVQRAPIAFDARSIWWFHAQWFARGGVAVASAMHNPAFAFSHPDYPPFAPATNAATWIVEGTRSTKHAQIVTAILTVSALSMLGYAVWRLAVPRVGPVVATATGGLLVAAGYGVAHVDPATNGYVDVLWAAAFAGACVFLLGSPQSRDALRWGIVLVAVAALTKNEGLVAAVLLTGVAGFRYRHVPRVGRWLVAGLLPGLTWVLIIRMLGVASESLDQSRTGRLVALDPAVTARIGPTAHAIGHEVAGLAAVAAVLTVATVVLAPTARRRLTGTPLPWLWVAWLGTVASVTFAYVVSSRPIGWHLHTSVTRTTIAANLVLLAEVALSTLALVAAARGATAGDGGAGPDDRSTARDVATAPRGAPPAGPDEEAVLAGRGAHLAAPR